MQATSVYLQRCIRHRPSCRREKVHGIVQHGDRTATRPDSHLHRAAWLLLGLLGLGRATAGRGSAVCRWRAGLVLEPDHDVAVREVEIGVRLHACRTGNDYLNGPTQQVMTRW